jgi:hypothetical protein
VGDRQRRDRGAKKRFEDRRSRIEDGNTENRESKIEDARSGAILHPLSSILDGRGGWNLGEGWL